MQINYTADAFASLISLINFIEEKNTNGAGIRWLGRYENFLSAAFLNTATIKLCRNKTFNRLQLKCIYFNDWVIAFSVSADKILIEALLHKSRISD